MGIKCKECKTINLDNARYCKKCGTKLSHGLKYIKYAIYLIVLILFLILISNGTHKKEAESNTTESYLYQNNGISNSTDLPIDQNTSNTDIGNQNNQAEFIENRDTNLTQEYMPKNGYVEMYKEVDSNTITAPLEINTKSGTNYYVKLKDFISQKTIMTIFVRGGERVEVKVPIGTYDFTYASGEDKWYGKDNLFGSNTQYGTLDTTLDFSYDGYNTTGHTLTLYSVIGGNLKTTAINKSQF